VFFYTRDPETNKLVFTHSVPVPFFPDNLMYDDEGILIAGGHAHLQSLLAVVADKPDAKAPSWVVSISPREQLKGEAGIPPKEYDSRAPVSASSRVAAVDSREVETMFQSNGKFFSTSTTGLRDSRTGALYVPGLYEEGLLVCWP
jgi:hypothetical protein